ncbi:MAG TPA: histidine kinase [Verrucomicrobiae bacterium]
MNSRLRQWSRRYAACLRRYVAQGQEAVLQEAYELGREASTRGVGVLEMARIHQRALAACLVAARQVEAKVRVLRAAETFFMETLAPFEAAHRGFLKANLELQDANQALEAGNRELERTNRQLEREVAARARSQSALLQSEEHFRELFHEAERMQESLRQLSNKILHVQEEERKRVSRELHDEVGQALTAISTSLEMLRRDAAAGPQSLLGKIADAQNLLAQTMDAVHRFAQELRPPMLDELGLLPALRSYLRGFAERTGLRVSLNGTAGAEGLSDEQKTVVFRVAQESLNNVAKHAQAKRVAVTFRQLKGSVQIRIQDNGKAFQVERQLAGGAKKRLGLLGMQERTRLVNGRFDITSAPGKGTTVSVEIPLGSPRNPAAGRHGSLGPPKPRVAPPKQNGTRFFDLR